MPDGSIKVDYATIHGAADDCSSTVKQLGSQFDQLKSDLNPLITTWEGDAKDAYLNAQKQWDDKFADLSQLLAQVASVLPQIADGYQSNETGVTGLF
jgi:early secretory antigenic target protein ESAT-6